MKDLAIIGAGGLGKEILVLIQQINSEKPTWNLVGFYDDNVSHSIAGFPILGSIQSLASFSKELAVVIALGSPEHKQKVVDSLINPKLYFPCLIHPAATIGLNVRMGAGTIVSAGCRLTIDIALGNHVLLNLNSTIGHDVTIGDFSSVMPGAHLSGFAQVGIGVMIGTGASVLQSIRVGDYAKIGAGAVVTDDVNSLATVVGIPAREKP
jgi:sugar O-acyltransferase (sialic acid O-acetyltransferase NeuD family)